VQTIDGRDFFVFLGIRPPDCKHHHLGRETFLAPLEWKEDGWPAIGKDGTVELEMNAFGLPPCAAFEPPPLRDDFDREELALCWNFVRNPNPEAFSLSERPGHLRLRGQRASLDDQGSPAFLGRRQQHFEFRAAALCEFDPSDMGFEAGLTLRANEENHYDLVLAMVDGKRSVRLRVRVGGETSLGVPHPLPEGAVELHVHATAEHYEFFVKSQGCAKEAIGFAKTAPLSSESAGTFTGTYIGMFAWSSSDEHNVPVDFDWFDYVPG
jgi:alpha-N-arabinofuranosidase